MKLLEVLLALFLTQIFVSFALNEREADKLDTSPEVLKNLDQEEKWILAGVEEPDVIEKGDESIQRLICTKNSCCKLCRSMKYKCGYCKSPVTCVCLRVS
ncbi:unnamed protein product [Hermetia illucens]|uniref:Uncharacterized protein n=1 Tax=Hermetia illucens TaxID=343691 RepID=A0A7R8UYG1_HERIL|nr:unnamed protein product [Hermetia illucens]